MADDDIAGLNGNCFDPQALVYASQTFFIEGRKGDKHVVA